jgi:hypothetical protein
MAVSVDSHLARVYMISRRDEQSSLMTFAFWPEVGAMLRRFRPLLSEVPSSARTLLSRNLVAIYGALRLALNLPNFSVKGPSRTLSLTGSPFLLLLSMRGR